MAALSTFRVAVATPRNGNPHAGEEVVTVRASDRHAARTLAENHYRAAHGLTASVFVVGFVSAVNGVGK